MAPILLPEILFSGTLAEIVGPLRVVPASSSVVVAAHSSGITVPLVLALGAALLKKRLSFGVRGHPNPQHHLHVLYHGFL